VTPSVIAPDDDDTNLSDATD